MITQGGKRDGANMAVMSVYHPDIMDFISCKSIEGDIHNFNISVGVDYTWMCCVENNMDYNLINPQTNEVVGKLNAREVFDKIIGRAWNNGEPGMIFLDRINRDNAVVPEYGEMIATNPCGEQPLLGNESCNLGSINLAKFFKKDDVNIPNLPTPWESQIDWRRLENVTQLATRFLDNVIDANYYATPDIEKMTKATRKIGLGVMGFADLLIKLGIPYNSKEGRRVGRHVMNFIMQHANNESLRLAEERGTFPAFNNSTLHRDNPFNQYRNACRMTVAPTGTISMIADCSSGIEPIFALAWKKQNILEGKTLNYVNKYFEEDAKREGFYSEELMDYLAEGGSLQDRQDIPLWVKRLYATAPDISPDDHVLMQAEFQTFVDSGISKTINFANKATKQDVEDAYMLAWKKDCKGITVYRAGSREKEVLVKGVKEEEPPVCCEEPQVVMQDGCESCKNCGWSACLIA
jgi:ribonucleoside-diphosphate reductase alpha chain